MTPPTTGELTAAIGFYLSLTGILGSFFFVHLSNWYREVLELEAKYRENRVGDDERRRWARVECRFQLARLINPVPLLVWLVISGFIAFLAASAWHMVGLASPRPLIFDYYESAFGIFLAVYLLLSLYFLLNGYMIGRRLRRQLLPAKP